MPGTVACIICWEGISRGSSWKEVSPILLPQQPPVKRYRMLLLIPVYPLPVPRISIVLVHFTDTMLMCLLKVKYPCLILNPTLLQATIRELLQNSWKEIRFFKLNMHPFENERRNTKWWSLSAGTMPGTPSISPTTKDRKLLLSHL